MWFDIEVNDEKGKCGEGSHRADHGKFKGDERQGCEQGGIRSIRFKYHARILPFWNKGERQIKLVVCMRVNRDKEKLLVTCVQ